MGRGDSPTEISGAGSARLNFSEHTFRHKEAMQIVIPMSGFGERFRRAGYTMPKPLIEVAGRPIISYVIDLFPGEQEILFICNEDHLLEPAFDLRNVLKRLHPSARIAGIRPHKKGPVYAVAQVADLIRDDAPVIVNYCDFTCYWDYAHFKHFVAQTGCEGAIPAYRGFHPHSLGSTFYAYLREANGWVSDIQEKQPFTDHPPSEFASSGTYYFASGAMMKEAFKQTMLRGLEVNDEYYVSLAYKPLLEAHRRIAVYELQHFMQWGTPNDLDEYVQYDSAFRKLASGTPKRPARHAGALMVPMAGSGARFAAADYRDPKPLVQVSGRPMAVAAAAGLPNAEQTVFVLRHDLPHVEKIRGAMRLAYPECRVVMLDELTEGQAVTCLRALDEVDVSLPLTIGACDTGTLYDAERVESLLQEDGTDVVVWGFRGHGAARRRPVSYGWINAKDGVVQGISVKAVLRDPAIDPVITGVFTFKRASDFKAAAERMIARNARVNGEFYIDTCINDAIALGQSVRLFEVDAYLCWGTPDELRTFEYWQSCFHKWDVHPYSLSRDGHVPVDCVDSLERRYAPVRPRLPAASK